MRLFSLAAAADDDEDVDDLAAGHGTMLSRHAAAASEFFPVFQPPSRVQTARRRQQVRGRYSGETRRVGRTCPLGGSGVHSNDEPGPR